MTCTQVRFAPRAHFRSIAILAVVSLAVTAEAQDTRADDSRRPQWPVTPMRLEELRVGPGGLIDGPPPVQPRACNQVASHTDADFTGGSYVAQGGFSQHEILAASYTLAASEFPIKIDSIEAIFVTHNATQETVTAWTVMVWAGTPSTGTLVFSASSDDELLPHLRAGPGTTGVNLRFMIDPGEAEQIIVSDIGTHTFSVGYRIDAHNSPPADPCTQSPATCCNAFPCTDTSGLGVPSRNWMNGLNCGPFGCPPNGGWASFSQLPALCRPSGDWVLRANWSSVSCQPGIGPCCVQGVCDIRTQEDCADSGGVYQGDGTSCAGIECPVPTEACCFEATGQCVNMTPSVCASAGGVAGGPGTVCATFTCFPTGACCLPNGSCVDGVSPEDCENLDGVFQGDETTCATVTCPEPQGACCFGNGFCFPLTAADCASAGADWMGAGSDCSDNNSNGTADACETTTPCPGDVNDDGFVNLNDLSTLLAHFGQSPATRGEGDLDNDNSVGLPDLAILLSNFGSECP